MKKFLLKVSVFMIYAFLLSVVIPILIDPFNVFHAERIRPNLIEPNKNYIKMKYILANPQRFNSFMFGSSRVGTIHTDNIPRERCYNMTYPTGLPGWHLLNIETLLKNGVCVQKVYIGLDSVSYTGNYDAQINDPMRCPYEYLAADMTHFMQLYLNPAMVSKALYSMLKASRTITGRIDADMFYKYGYGVIEEHRKNIDWSKAAPSVSGNVDIDKALEFTGKIVDICRENNIELILFTIPMHHLTYMGSVMDKEYLRFLEGLAEISDFWNFSSLNDITLSNDCYLETSHYRAEVGDIMLNVMCSGEVYPELQAQGFGVKVTRDNVKDFIAMLRKQAEDFRHKNSPVP